MRAFVFTDRALEGQAGRFVWLSIDTEKEKNASFLDRFPIEAYPTFLIVDPEREQAAFRWIGGATVGQLQRLLDDGERALRRKGIGADAALAEADRLLARGREAAAAAEYKRAIARAAPDWPGRDRAVESLLTVLGMLGADEECVETARAELEADRTLHLASVAAAGLGCASSLGAETKAEAVARFETAARSAVGEPRIEMPADDRSSLYGSLVEARKAAGDQAGARIVAAEWLAFLDGEAAGAASAEARAVLDSHRLAAAIAAGEPARAIPALEQSEKDLPDDYNPPARLAVAYKEAGSYDEALAAADRALRLAYGPRKLRVYSTKADILEKRGDPAAAKATIEDAIRYATALPRAQRSPRAIGALKTRLAALQ